MRATVMRMFLGRGPHAFIHGHPDVPKAVLCEGGSERQEVLWVLAVDALKAGLGLEQGGQIRNRRILAR